MCPGFILQDNANGITPRRTSESVEQGPRRTMAHVDGNFPSDSSRLYITSVRTLLSGFRPKYLVSKDHGNFPSDSCRFKAQLVDQLDADSIWNDWMYLFRQLIQKGLQKRLPVQHSIIITSSWSIKLLDIWYFDTN